MNLNKQLRINLWIALSVWAVWLFTLGAEQAFSYVADNWQVTLTMVFGSLVAGATSEGGGAIAFPVFTKALHVIPSDAKMFALAIQSVGMTAAALLIVLMRVKVEWRVIFWVSIGGSVGMLIGARWLAPYFPADVIKMTFTVLASSFAMVLLIINRKDRNCHQAIPIVGSRERQLLLAVGVLGGMLSSLVGTGIDILTFSMLVLLFRINEKVATPTSVVLMAINSIVGLFIFGGLLGQMNDQVFGYWMAAIPVVVIGAPMGAIICSYMSRKSISNFLIGLISIELASSLIIIPMRETVVIFSLVTLVTCLIIYFMMLQSQRYVAVISPAD